MKTMFVCNTQKEEDQKVYVYTIKRPKWPKERKVKAAPS